VGDGDFERQGGDRGGVHLKPISTHGQQVGPGAGEGLPKPDHPKASRFGHPFRAIRGNQHLNPLSDGKSVLLDPLDRPAEFRGQVHSCNVEEQPDVLVLFQAPEQRQVDAIIRPADCHDTDGSHVLGSIKSA
jgi:hypothetical protein